MTPENNNNLSVRAAAAKASFVTRRVKLGDARQLVTDRSPRSGDLILARVVKIKRQTRLELRNGRRAHLYESDELVLAYGNRYASDQYEAGVPDHLGPCQLVAAGGIAAKVISKHGNIRDATEIKPLGLLAGIKGNILNLADYALPVIGGNKPRPLTVAVFGSSMNSGKTTMVSDLVHGACRLGIKVSAAKLTGTGSGPDIWKVVDAGASEMLDFTDEGYASTAGLELQQLLSISRNLIARTTTNDTKLLVLEIADGLLQQETRALLESPEFRRLIDGCLFASSDSVAAVAAVNYLQSLPLDVLAIGGIMTQSSLTPREAVSACGIPYLKRCDLQRKAVVRSLLRELTDVQKRAQQESGNVIAIGN